MDRQLQWGRWAVALLFICAIAAFFVFNLGRWFSFDALNSNKVWLQDSVAARPVVSVALFSLVYVAVTSLSLPFATAMTLLGGALFGRWWGTILVNLSATTGATVAFLAARYLLRGWVQRRMEAVPAETEGESPKVRRARARQAAWRSASDGIRTSGFNYLLVLRLLPIVPFFLINLVAGLSPLSVRAFILATLIGTLPGTFLYVNAGSALGTLSRPSDLISWQVLGALGLLALFSLIPVAWRRWRKA
jgi:uncharacterized membrane protein YdjX (TVP38/TMEM64 family)